jgi:hypothetical protein
VVRIHLLRAFSFWRLAVSSNKKKSAPKVRLELTTYRLTAGRAADCAIRDQLSKKVEKTQLRSMRGSNPRLLAHKTNTLPTELMEPV